MPSRSEQVAQLGLPGELAPEPPALHLRHVPDQPEQRQRRRRHGPRGELLTRQTGGLVADRLVLVLLGEQFCRSGLIGSVIRCVDLGGG